MGNALRFLCGDCCSPRDAEGSTGPHGVALATVGFSALARDLFEFENTGQVPEELSQHVEPSRKAQANWYKKILAAWKEAKPPPSNAEEAAILIAITLQRHHRKVDVEGLLSFYGLPYPTAVPERVAQKRPELYTLPVNAKDVGDGDGLTVYVDTRNPRESADVPISVQEATIQRREARARRDYEMADALKECIFNEGYWIIDDGDILAHRYRIRLRGVDAPELKMPYGEEAKQALVSLVQGEQLRVVAYGNDQYDRLVGDIYSKDVFIQEVLLKKGCVWHYKKYDQRPEFAMWEKEARAARVGLWASSNPQKPWEWRKIQKEMQNNTRRGKQ